MQKICSYTGYMQKIIDLNATKILRAMGDFNIDKETNEIFIPFRKEQYFNENLIETCKMLQYKYCMPIKFLSNEIRFIPYSTYKLIKILYPSLSRKASNLPYVLSVLDKIKDQKVVLYAAGGIEKSPDGGRQSREILKTSLSFTKSLVVNPCDFEYNKSCLTLTEFKNKNGILKTWILTSRVVESDCDAVKSCNAIVLILDKYVGTGSTSECTLAKAMNKPVYAILYDGFKKEDTNVWLLGCITRFFNSPDSFRAFLTDIE